MSIQFNFIFGNLSGWEKLTGLDGNTISGITLAVLVILYLLDVAICCGGCCLLCCLCYKTKKSSKKTYRLNQVERTSRHFPKASRLSRVSNSTTGGTDVEWVQDKSGSLVHKSFAEESNLGPVRESPTEPNVYEEPHPDAKDKGASTRSSGYVVMSRLKPQHDDSNNYDDITNTKLYDDVMNALPSLNPDAGTYDDITNVRGVGTTSDYEDVLNVRINPH